jgi:hypothetical protein
MSLCASTSMLIRSRVGESFAIQIQVQLKRIKKPRHHGAVLDPIIETKMPGAVFVGYVLVLNEAVVP